MKAVTTIAFKLLILLSIITGVVYPLVVTVVGRLIFPFQSEGSIVTRDGVSIGSQLLAQKFVRDDYFHSRPSATNYTTVPTGASNYSPVSAQFIKQVESRQNSLGQEATEDLLTQSASGLDPDISLRSALVQVPRIAKTRQLSQQQINNLVAKMLKTRTLFFMGEPRINVLELNISLDSLTLESKNEL